MIVKIFPNLPVQDVAKSIDFFTTIGFAFHPDFTNETAGAMIVNAAVEAGGRAKGEATDHGFMYGWGFHDLDGHIWEVFHMDPSALSGQA